MVENVVSVSDLQNQNKDTKPVSFVKESGLKQTTSFLQDIRGILEVVRDITGVDVMGKMKEISQNAKVENSNAVKIEAGIDKKMAMISPIEKSISIKVPRAIELIKEGLSNLPEDQTIGELKKQFEENQSLLEPFIIKYVNEVTFLQ